MSIEDEFQFLNLYDNENETKFLLLNHSILIDADSFKNFYIDVIQLKFLPFELCDEIKISRPSKTENQALASTIFSIESDASEFTISSIASSLSHIDIHSFLGMRGIFRANCDIYFFKIIPLSISYSFLLNGYRKKFLRIYKDQKLHKKNFQENERINLKTQNLLFDDIAGYHDVKNILLEHLSMCKSKIYSNYNIKPPKGVLLYGPPGCSKTLLARALSNESGRYFQAIKGPEIFSKWVGDSEKNLHKIFENARINSPGLIFFDEIDSIASSRNESTLTVSNRVLAQFLCELDGLLSDDIIVLAATNRPDILDPALLRPGRLDTHLYVGLPSYADRLEMYYLISKKINLMFDQENFARLTDGYTGAEIMFIIQEASSYALDLNKDSIDIDLLKLSLEKNLPRTRQSLLEYYDNIIGISDF